MPLRRFGFMLSEWLIDQGQRTSESVRVHSLLKDLINKKAQDRWEQMQGFQSPGDVSLSPGLRTRAAELWRS